MWYRVAKEMGYAAIAIVFVAFAAMAQQYPNNGPQANPQQGATTNAQPQGQPAQHVQPAQTPSSVQQQQSGQQMQGVALGANPQSPNSAASQQQRQQELQLLEQTERQLQQLRQLMQQQR